MSAVFVRTFRAMSALVITTLLALLPAFGQPGENRVAVGADFGLSKYWGDFGDNSLGIGGDLFVRWNIVPAFSIHGLVGLSGLRYNVTNENILANPDYYGPLGQGTGTGLYPNSTIDREANNTIRVNTYALAASYNLFTGGKLVPYLFAGIGAANFEPRNDKQNVPLPNYDANLYERTVLVVPLGVGAEWYVEDNLTLNAKLQIHLTGTNYLDDLAPTGTSNDGFGLFSVGVSYYIFGALDCDKDLLTDAEERRLGTDPCNVDTDGDGLGDFDEVRTYGTDPTRADTDGDGLNDREELQDYRTDPKNPDTDADGLTDGDEVARKTDPKNRDSDGDGLTDGDEVNRYKTNPLAIDTDGDNLNDGDELNVHKTDPLMADSDGDGLKDGEEITTYQTDPKDPDTDRDELRDGEEVRQYKTNPTRRDTDNDKLDDGEEVLRVRTNPLNPDTDADAVIDGDDLCPLIAGVRERNGCPAPPKVGTITNFPAIYFIVDTDQFDFSRPETSENLANMLAYVNQCPGLGVVIEGHASREGSDKRNQELSEMRARRIETWLIERGVDSAKIEATIGYGSRVNAVEEPEPNSPEAKKMDPMKLEEIRRQNRRIAVKVVRTCD